MSELTTMIVISYSQEPRLCKNSECKVCLAGKKHPAYWFASAEINNVEHHIFLGTRFRQVHLREFIKIKYSDDKNKNLREDRDATSSYASSFQGHATEQTATSTQDEAKSYQPGSNDAFTDDSEETLELKEVYDSFGLTVSSLMQQNSQTPLEKSFASEHRLSQFKREVTGSSKETKEKVATTPFPNGLPSEREFQNDLRRFKNIRYKDVKMEYRLMIKKYHPDQFGVDQPKIQEWMKIINIVHDGHIRRMQRFYR